MQVVRKPPSWAHPFGTDDLGRDAFSRVVWGNAARRFLETAPWMAWWPGLAIFSLALSFNLAGDGVRDLLDPKELLTDPSRKGDSP